MVPECRPSGVKFGVCLTCSVGYSEVKYTVTPENSANRLSR
jgi:hypothetical protein